MAKKKKIKEEKLKPAGDSIGSIGEFVTPKPEDEIPEGVNIDEPEEPEPQTPSPQGQGGLKDIPPEQIKEKLLTVISEVATRGLDEEAKAKFNDNFIFWNGIAWELLDVGSNLTDILDKVHVKMSPAKATLLYLGGTAAMVFALRPDLIKKMMPRKKGEVLKEETVEPKVPEQPQESEKQPEASG